MIGPSGPLEKNLVIIFTLWPWNFWSKNATAKDKMVARPASPSPIVCAADTTWVSKVHHSQYSGIEQLLYSCSTGSQLIYFWFPASSRTGLLYHIFYLALGILVYLNLACQTIPSTRPLGLLAHLVQQNTWSSRILGPQYHMVYSTVTQVCPARPWGSQHSTVN